MTRIARTLTASAFACALLVATTARAGVIGTWYITWDWSQGDGGSGANVPITFSPGHVFTVGQESGRWTKHGKHLTLHFGSANTCHGTWKSLHTPTGYAGTMRSACHGAGTWSITR